MSEDGWGSLTACYIIYTLFVLYFSDHVKHLWIYTIRLVMHSDTNNEPWVWTRINTPYLGRTGDLSGVSLVILETIDYIATVPRYVVYYTDVFYKGQVPMSPPPQSGVWDWQSINPMLSVPLVIRVWQQQANVSILTYSCSVISISSHPSDFI